MKEIAEGVHQLEVPMRRNPLGKTYSYLLEGAATLIDTGVPTGDGFEALKDQLRKLGLALGNLERVIITHLHRDHIGLIDRIRAESEAEIVALDEAVKIQRKWTETADRFFEDSRDEIRLWGGGSFLKFMGRYEHAFRGPRPTLEIDETITDGEMYKLKGHQFQAFWTPGHAREHLCLHDAERRLLFSGDHVLPKITSHVSLHTYQDLDPLKDYLASLKRLRGLDVNMVLPGHEHAFEDLEGRISALLAHHEGRCGEMKEAITNGAETVFDISSKVHWDSRPWPLMSFWTKRMAAAETYAHLAYLRNRSEVVERVEREALRYGLV